MNTKKKTAAKKKKTAAVVTRPNNTALEACMIAWASKPVKVADAKAAASAFKRALEGDDLDTFVAASKSKAMSPDEAREAARAKGWNDTSITMMRSRISPNRRGLAYPATVAIATIMKNAGYSAAPIVLSKGKYDR